MLYYKGKCSTFGGPGDTGVSETEGLALCTTPEHFANAQELFLRQDQGPRARNLDPRAMYVACRWDYRRTKPAWLRSVRVRVTNLTDGRYCEARPIDWGPAPHTGRAVDLSPAIANALGLKTDDEVFVALPEPGDPEFPDVPGRV